MPDPDGQVWGEVYEMTHPVVVLRALDELEGYRPSEPEASLYTRRLTPVTMEDGDVVYASAYFYNAPLGRAERIVSGDYLNALEFAKMLVCGLHPVVVLGFSQYIVSGFSSQCVVSGFSRTDLRKSAIALDTCSVGSTNSIPVQ